jgi:hypothetical protein
VAPLAGSRSDVLLSKYFDLREEPYFAVKYFVAMLSWFWYSAPCGGDPSQVKQIQV